MRELYWLVLTVNLTKDEDIAKREPQLKDWFYTQTYR